VVLSGSFNDWDPDALKMRRSENGWFLEMPLAGGKHLYKFVVDNNWITDPANPRTETTWDGFVNSVLLVR
jgi:1,4-alpha-glucan branching enzyme